MMIESKVGEFEILKNYRDAFDIIQFEEKYIHEIFNKYPYMVGDVSDGKLRLRGFDNQPKSEQYFKFIPDYLTESCSMGCPYYILKRIGNPKKRID